MSIIRNYREGNTQLNKLKFQGNMGSGHPGNPPLIQKRVPTETQAASPIRGTELSARLDDVGRIAQIFTRREGLQFLANNAALNNTVDQSYINNPLTAQERFQKLKSNLAFTAKDTLLTLASTLASIPVAGTGTHFIKGALGSRQYLNDGKAGINLRLLEGEKSPIQKKETSLPEELLRYYYYGGSKNPNNLTPEDFTAKPENWKNSYKLNTESSILNTDLTRTTVNIGQPGKVKVKYDTEGKFYDAISDEISVDKINRKIPFQAPENSTDGIEDDYVKFIFEILPIDSSNSTFIQFRSYLDSFDDGYTGDWTSVNYIGRGESFYNYKGFSRSVILSFKAAAGTRKELLPIYEKINYLASTTAPSYSGNNLMRGTVVKVTVGDYLRKIPGIITSVNYAWKTGYQWEIKDTVLPHILDCTLSFTPIHSFVPKQITPLNITNSAFSAFKVIPSGQVETLQQQGIVGTNLSLQGSTIPANIPRPTSGL